MLVKGIIILTGPSAVGKKTIEKHLFNNPKLRLSFSISTTTRKPRKFEKDGQDYFFITDKEFQKLIDKDQFLEWHQHFKHKYGTLKSEIARIDQENKIAFLEVDVQGAINLMKNKNIHNKLLTIFLSPPSLNSLEQRILKRKLDSKLQINARLKRALSELELIDKFNYVVVNHKVEDAVQEIEKIIRKHFKWIEQ